ncbi:hypothetical protein yc1106_07764 [Curvularia clavata]|uniref:F-box domain-containing protein n=1 Tax=Curvularia clavata TaxID=95742 RepID=A0A9Q8ZE06_CURCL|nr:hypothetical protein yc1106_07764 [Curvularia clavata]
MSLLELPPEILITIFEYVGSQSFRSELTRLMVCKQWYAFARTAYFHDLRITTKILRRLLASPYAETNLARIQKNAVRMELEFQGFEDWDSFHASSYDLPEVSWHVTYGRVERLAWTPEFNNDLLRLAKTVKKSQKLRCLRIQAITELHENTLLEERRHYLFTWAIRPFLSKNALTTLDLDLVGTELVQGGKDGQEFHACVSIAALLTTLLRLRLRMRRICANVLNTGGPDKKLRLNEVIINLSLANESPLVSSFSHAKCCNTSSSGLPQLQHALEEQAGVLVTQMENPMMVRILRQEGRMGRKMQAFDVLTGKTIVFEDGTEWDGEGKIIEEKVSDGESGESEISELSSDSDV